MGAALGSVVGLAGTGLGPPGPPEAALSIANRRWDGSDEGAALGSTVGLAGAGFGPLRASGAAGRP